MVHRPLPLLLVALAVTVLGLGAQPSEAWASAAQPCEATIHVISGVGTDAIVIESTDEQGNAVFGMVDAGEDDDCPDGSDPRYPLRSGIVKPGSGIQDDVIAYLTELGVKGGPDGNFEFFVGTHPHSDHIGGANEVIEAFAPKRLYALTYSDSFITGTDRLWDNQYVYDQMIQAAREEGATIIHSFRVGAPVDPRKSAGSAEAPDPDEGAPAPGSQSAPVQTILASEALRLLGIDATKPDGSRRPTGLLPDSQLAVATALRHYTTEDAQKAGSEAIVVDLSTERPEVSGAGKTTVLRYRGDYPSLRAYVDGLEAPTPCTVAHAPTYRFGTLFTGASGNATAPWKQMSLAWEKSEASAGAAAAR